MEDEEALQPRAVVSQTADSVEHSVDDLLADRVVASAIQLVLNSSLIAYECGIPGVVVGRVLLARDHLLGMEQMLVRARADLICKLIRC